MQKQKKNKKAANHLMINETDLYTNQHFQTRILSTIKVKFSHVSFFKSTAEPINYLLFLISYNIQIINDKSYPVILYGPL